MQADQQFCGASHQNIQVIQADLIYKKSCAYLYSISSPDQDTVRNLRAYSQLQFLAAKQMPIPADQDVPQQEHLPPVDRP